MGSYKIKEKTRVSHIQSKTSSVHLCWEWKEFAKEVNQRMGEDQGLLEKIVTQELERRMQAELGQTPYQSRQYLKLQLWEDQDLQLETAPAHSNLGDHRKGVGQDFQTQVLVHGRTHIITKGTITLIF